MNLGTVRDQFLKMSGRYDLGTLGTDSPSTNGTDLGGDFYLNAGMKVLDRMRDGPKALGRYFNELAADAWYDKFQLCRSVKEVWINNTSGRSQLEKKDINWLRAEYSGLISGTDSGTPLYYAPAELRVVDATDMDSLGGFFNYVYSTTEDYNGVVFLPQTDEAIVLEVWGHFYTEEMSSNSDRNFWTDLQPMLLLMAALYQLEVSYRNTEGANDWMRSIELQITTLDFDTVEQDVQDVDQMEG
jgi:hypothetical protein